MEALAKVPASLRRLLFDLTLSYLLENPVDYVEHGLNYFRKLQADKTDKRVVVAREVSDSSSEESMEVVKVSNIRRATVYAEKYNPEDDSLSDCPIFPKTDEERKALSLSVRNVLLFRVLSRDSFNTVIDAMKTRSVVKDEVIIEQGDTDAAYFYLVREGVFEASIRMDDGSSKVVRTYDNSGSFGELALLYNMPRAATVQAVTDGLLWEMERPVFRKIVLRGAFVKRERYQKLIEKVEFLKDLSSYAKLDLADSLMPQQYSDEEEIFHQDDVADGMYFVESGQVTLVLDHPAKGRVVINELHSGAYLGELALLTHRHRALTAIAQGETKLAFLDKDTFERLLGPCSEVLKEHFAEYENQMIQAVGSGSSYFYNLTDDP